MTQKTTSPVNLPALGKRMLIGAGIALLLISVFLLMADEPNPEWPKLWFLQPLIVVPAAGAGGGLFYFLMDPMRRQGGWKMILANFLSFIVYVFGLWIGTVLGLNGTMWN